MRLNFKIKNTFFVGCTATCWIKICLSSILFCGALAVSFPVNSQVPGKDILPPQISLFDENGVDLSSGKYPIVSHAISIGSGESGTSNSPANFSNSQFEGGIVDVTYSTMTVVVSGRTEFYTYKADLGVYLSAIDSSYIKDVGVSPDRYFIMTKSNGDRYFFKYNFAGVQDVQYQAVLVRVERANGEVISIDAKSLTANWIVSEVEWVDCLGDQSCPIWSHTTHYYTTFYVAGHTSSHGWMASSGIVENKPAKLLLNLSEDYCQFGSNLCAGSAISPYYSGNRSSERLTRIDSNDYEYVYYSITEIINENYIDSLGNLLKFSTKRWRQERHGPSGYSGERVDNINSIIAFPSGRQKSITYTGQDCFYYPNDPSFSDVNNVVEKITIDGREWSYNYQCDGLEGVLLTTKSNPLGGVRKVATQRIGGNIQRIISDEDELGNIRKYEYDSLARLTKVVSSQATYTGTTLTGGYTQYSYNAKGNVTESREVARAGTGQADRVTTAAYPVSCTDLNYKICNKPEWVRDARGNLPANVNNVDYRMEYTYSTVHGGVLTEKLPPNEAGVRLMTRYEYEPLYAQIKNSSGTLVNAEGPIYKLTRVSSCASTQTQCNLVGDTVTEYEYVHNNLLMTKTTVRSGDNTVSASTLYEYDYVGNTTAVDGPLAGTVDKAYTTYDVLRRKVFEIGPDPDGDGPLKRQIVRHKYDADGLEIRTESGTVSDSNGPAFSYAAFNIANPDLAPYTWATAKNMYYDGAAQLVKTEVVVP